MEKNTLEISGAVLNSSVVVERPGSGHVLVTEPPHVTMMWNQHAVPWVDILLALVCIVLTLVSTCGNAVSIRAIIKLKSRFVHRTLLVVLLLRFCML